MAAAIEDDGLATGERGNAARVQQRAVFIAIAMQYQCRTAHL
jgi:hypothetical protein